MPRPFWRSSLHGENTAFHSPATWSTCLCACLCTWWGQLSDPFYHRSRSVGQEQMLCLLCGGAVFAVVDGHYSSSKTKWKCRRPTDHAPRSVPPCCLSAYPASTHALSFSSKQAGAHTRTRFVKKTGLHIMARYVPTMCVVGGWCYQDSRGELFLSSRSLPVTLRLERKPTTFVG